LNFESSFSRLSRVSRAMACGAGGLLQHLDRCATSLINRE
jgi:hypothetical protein